MFTIKQLTQNEKLFCYYYSSLQNPKEAAVKAGYKPLIAELTAAKLLSRPQITAYIKKLYEKKADDKMISSIVTGLNRLAFCSSADSLKLMLCDRDFLTEHLDELDLFHISEIKIPKDGSIEIKFFDRFKAFDKLLEISRFNSNSDDAADFFSALEQSAKAVGAVGVFGADKNAVNEENDNEI